MFLAHLKRLISLFTIICFIALPNTVLALPQGEVVTEGNALFNRFTPDTLKVTQGSDKLITNYDSFSIAEQESVQFLQPSSSSVALNRVVGADPSAIMGNLSANGQVFLINPNGIVFGATSQVDTAALVASTLNISDQDFLDGNYQFNGSGGLVVNYGALNSPGGYVALLGSQVENGGVIQADLGSVALASGDAMTMDLDAQGYINVVVSDAGSQNDQNRDAAVQNTGRIQANGGKVLLTAETLNSVFDNAINNDGIIEATSLQQINGEIVLMANNNVNVGGNIKGGDVTVRSEDGNVVHRPDSNLTTAAGNFVGYAGNDYRVEDGTQIDVDGIVDILAENDVILGTNGEAKYSEYEWDYVSDTRQRRLSEFGYYVFGENNQLVYVPVVQGTDIGKDGSTPTSGSGVVYGDGSDLDLYVVFQDSAQGYVDPAQTNNTTNWTYHEADDLNGDNLQHVDVNDTRYGWEDIYNQGDQDFDDAVFDFDYETVVANDGAVINSTNQIFVTAKNGSITQFDGEVCALDLMLAANTGITGVGVNNGLENTATNISAVNTTSGDIRLDNLLNASITDLSQRTGLNDNVGGSLGVQNLADCDIVDIHSRQDLDIRALVRNKGNVRIESVGTITQYAGGDIIVDQAEAFGPGMIENVDSTTHTSEVWTNVSEIETTWELTANDPALNKDASIVAGADFIQNTGSSIQTNGGDVDVAANGNIQLALIDAQNGKASVVSQNGSITDSDLSVAPTDYDVIAHTINLKADNGTVGSGGAEGQIDLGFPDADFTYAYDLNNTTNLDATADPFDANLNEEGEWVYSSRFQTTQDSDNWWFHVASLDDGALVNPTENLGPFYIDTIAPVITAGDPIGDIADGEITVPFSATDELSGFNPNGDLNVDLNSETFGPNVIVTSEGVFDQAGNFTPGIPVGPFGGGVIPPTPPVVPPTTPIANNNPEIPITFEGLTDLYRVYYEILDTSRFSNFIPTTKTGLFAYHPVTDTDASAFDSIDLDVGAYEYINEQIERRKNRLPYLFSE